MVAQKQIATYHILMYGGPTGYQTDRAQITLYGNDEKAKAYVRFNDPGMSFEYHVRERSTSPACTYIWREDAHF